MSESIDKLSVRKYRQVRCPKSSAAPEITSSIPENTEPPMKQSKFSFHKRLKSFTYAINGLRILIREEHNARIHVVAGILAVVAGFVLDISKVEWLAIILSIGFVLAMELVNSAIENIADFVSPERHETIKKIKDLAAGSVLVSTLTALIVGLMVFVPKVLSNC